MNDLLPGKTVVMAERYVELSRVAWRFEGPLLLTEGEESGVRRMQSMIHHRISRLGLMPSRWRRFFEDNGVVAVMTEYFGFASEIGRALQKRGIRWYVHGHGHDLSKALAQGRGQAKIEACNRADGIIVVGSHQRQRLIERGMDGARIHVVPCGTTAVAEYPRTFSSEPIRCVSVGRMVEKKAPLKTLEAFCEAASGNTELRLEMIGGGGMLEQVRRFISEHRLDDLVTIHGSKPAEFVEARLRDSHIFLLHSVTASSGDEEGLPVSILESMAHGMPVVATRHAGIPDAVTENETGFLVDEGDVSGMAACITRLASNPSLAEAMGKAGRRRFLDRFTFERERANLLEIMQLAETPSSDPELDFDR